MLKVIHHHILHYLILAVILVTGLILFISYKHRIDIQWNIAVVIAALYAFWGVWHHFALDRHIYAKIVVEYILISVIGLILIRGVLF